VLLLREVERRINLMGRLGGCFRDGRNQDQVEHKLSEMLAQRVYGLALGYEDLNDHEQLRSDPLLGVLSGKRNLDEPLAGKSTLNRLELSGRTGRYHKIGYSAEAIDRLLVDLFIESRAAPPAEIVLDLDATDIPLYGHQPERFFHRGPRGQVFVRGVAPGSPRTGLRPWGGTVITTATAICRCTSSLAINCCARGSGRPTRMPQPVRLMKQAASLRNCASAGLK
jgi:hypothetical protein